MKKMTSALIIIGNEILSGRTKDANAAYIGEKMGACGVPLSEVRVIPDIEDKVVEAVNTLRAEYDYVFTTGGIGPTHDDITSACIAKALGVEFGRNEEAYKVLEDYYPPGELTPARATMADIPAGAKLLPNPVSGAPGFYIENVFVMAGVPRIMQAMLDTVLDIIDHGAPILSRAVICNLPESVIAEGLGDIQAEYKDVDIGSYPRFQDGKLSVSVVLRGTEDQILETAAKKVVELIRLLEGEILG